MTKKYFTLSQYLQKQYDLHRHAPRYRHIWRGHRYMHAINQLINLHKYIPVNVDKGKYVHTCV